MGVLGFIRAREGTEWVDTVWAWFVSLRFSRGARALQGLCSEVLQDFIYTALVHFTECFWDAKTS